MRRHPGGETFRYVLIFLTIVIMAGAVALLMMSCAGNSGEGSSKDTEGKKIADAGNAGSTKDTEDAGDAGGVKGAEAGDPEAPGSGSTAESKGKSRTFRLSSGKTIKLDPKGRISKKSVYKLKSGTRLSGSDLKKTGSSGRYFRIYRISKGDSVYKRINGKSYKSGSSIGLSDLAYIRTLYRDFDGKTRTGEIIVNKAIADDTLAVFRELYRIKYQIRKMRLVDDYWEQGGQTGTGADTASMNDDNTSGFNYRMVAGTSTVSKHGYGRAIDVNPFENPWCPGGKLYSNQSASAEYANRNVRRPHMIFADSDVTKVFKGHGFRWLGETGTRDYQHFEK